MRLLHDTSTWADAIADLPAVDPLPCRTVLVFNERVAHALRRELLLTDRVSVLAGTRFVTPLAAATEVLLHADVAFRLDDPTLRPLRLARAFRQLLPLKHFPSELLLNTAGWDAAFARTLNDLEGAGLRPADLRFASAKPQLLDVATIWEAVDALAGEAWTGARVIAEAGVVLERDPSHWSFEGPTLATLSSSFSAGEARFSRGIPGVELALFSARPLRSAFLDRLAALLGKPAVDALTGPPFDPIAKAAANAPDATERAVLAACFLETPEALAHAERPRSRGPDGTVHLEEHAGVEAELEAAADWVARQVLEHGTPLDQIAILVPRSEPLSGMVAQRIARLGAAGDVPVFVASGIGVSTSAAGARMLLIVRALRAHLPVDSVAELLSFLRLADPEQRRLSRGRASALAYALGTAGGNAADPRGALTWRARLSQRAAQLEHAVAIAHTASEPVPENARDTRAQEELLGDLRNVAGALGRLSDLAGLVLDGSSLAQLWPELAGYLTNYVLLPAQDEGAPLLSLLAATMQRACVDPELAAVSGSAALAIIEDELSSLRQPGPRYGAPAVYVGTIQGAAGLPFEAIRIVGLAEGHWPSVGREDAVLPDALRLSIPGDRLRTGVDHAVSQLHALAMVVRAARRQVVLSMARVDVDRSQREPSAVFLEAAAALGRPVPAGEAAAVIPDLRALRRDAFQPARAWAESYRKEWPMSAAAWQSRVARHAQPAPASWFGAPATELAKIRTAREHGAIAVGEGLLGAKLDLDLPGLTAERPISASGLQELLRCPHRFLLQRVLGWWEPSSASPQREIDPMTYGSLFHSVAEDFFVQHGEAFSARQSSVVSWRAESDQAAEQALGALLESYPLVGEAVRKQQLTRLRNDLGRFIDHEWNAAVPPQFVAAEHAFGYAEPAALDAGGSQLFVRGYIDRIDVEGKRLMVRDFKTGRAHPRQGDEAGPTPSLDLQIGVYASVVRPMADARGIGLGAAYVYTGLHPDRERAFRDDIAVLETATAGWLKLAGALLRERAFVRTPDEDDCRFCSFSPVCGDEFYPGVGAMLETHRRGALRMFRELKLPEAP